MSKLPTFGVTAKNNFRLTSPKIGGLKYSAKTNSVYSPKVETNKKSVQKNINYDINIDDYVFIKSTNQKGTVRYVGETKFKTGIWVGVELDKRGAGKNNGTVMGVMYFKCPPATGLFIPITAVEKIGKDHDDDATSEVSAISTDSKFNMRNKNRITINTDIKSSSKLGKTVKTPLKSKIGNKSDSLSKLNSSRSLSTTSIGSIDGKPPKTPKTSKLSNSSVSLNGKSPTKTRNSLKSISTSAPGSLKNLYSPHLYSPTKDEMNDQCKINSPTSSPKKINKKLIPVELKESENDYSMNYNKKELFNEFKGANSLKQYDDHIYIKHNEEKLSADTGVDSGCEDDTIKVNENYETNTNEEAAIRYDDDFLSEKYSISSSTINGSPQDRKRSSVISNFNVNKNAITLPNSTPASPISQKSNKFIDNQRRYSFDMNNNKPDTLNFTVSPITKHSSIYNPESLKPLEILSSQNKDHSPLSPKSQKSNIMTYQAQSLSLHQQNEESDDNDIPVKSRNHSSSFSVAKSKAMVSPKALKTSKSLYFDLKKNAESKSERSRSFSSQKNIKFSDQESIKDMYEQEKDYMNNTSEEMRYSLDKFQTLIDRLTLQNSIKPSENKDDDQESKKIIAELTHELIKTKEESKELQEKLNHTEDKMNSLLNEKQSLEDMIENIKSKKDNIQQNYQNNMDQLHGDIEEKSKKLDDLESKFRYYFEQYNIISEEYNKLKEDFDIYAEESRNEKDTMEQEFAMYKNQLLLER